MTESQQLLAEYTEKGSEEAFRELVRRYINLVYSTALRLVNGNAHSAEDVTQTVFIHLSRSARTFPPDVMLGGWLHRDTCYVASKLLRQERRRQARETQAALMDSAPDHSRAYLEQVSPILDDAINALPEEDRTAIMLRFFEQQDFRSVGFALRSNEDAARMRVSRALDKLHSLLKRRGVTLSVSALAAGLTSEAVSAAPVGLAASVAGAAIAASASVGAVSSVTLKILTMTNIKMLVTGSVIVCGMAIPLALQHRSKLELAEENHQLSQRVQDLLAANESLSNKVTLAAARPGLDAERERELLKLRGEVGTLRRQVREASRAASKPAAVASTDTRQTSQEYAKELGIAKMNYTKGWMLAFFMYAEKNGGQFPTNFSQALPFWPSDLKLQTSDKGEVPLQPDESAGGTTQYGLVPDNYDVVYQGTLNALTNAQSIIVIREKDAWQTTDGGWVRTYAFADGHTEIHKANDGNFAPWEQQHMAAQTDPGQTGPAPAQLGR